MGFDEARVYADHNSRFQRSRRASTSLGLSGRICRRLGRYMSVYCGPVCYMIANGVSLVPYEDLAGNHLTGWRLYIGHGGRTT